jgi:hypothetical protein
MRLKLCACSKQALKKPEFLHRLSLKNYQCCSFCADESGAFVPCRGMFIDEASFIAKKEAPKATDVCAKRLAATKRANAILERVNSIIAKARNHFYRGEYALASGALQRAKDSSKPLSEDPELVRHAKQQGQTAKYALVMWAGHRLTPKEEQAMRGSAYPEESARQAPRKIHPAPRAAACDPDRRPSPPAPPSPPAKERRLVAEPARAFAEFDMWSTPLFFRCAF